jgi:hypothetical protein
MSHNIIKDKPKIKNTDLVHALKPKENKKFNISIQNCDCVEEMDICCKCHDNIKGLYFESLQEFMRDYVISL